MIARARSLSLSYDHCMTIAHGLMQFQVKDLRHTSFIDAHLTWSFMNVCARVESVRFARDIELHFIKSITLLILE